MSEAEESCCGRHLNMRMERLLYPHPLDPIAYLNVTVSVSLRGGSVKCVVCGKIAPMWQLKYRTKKR